MNAQSKPPKPARGPEPSTVDASAPPLVSLDSAIFKDVRVQLKAKLGELTLTIEELLALKAGQVLPLDRMLNEPVDLYLNQAVVARGEIVAVDDNFGVRLVEIAAPR